MTKQRFLKGSFFSQFTPEQLIQAVKASNRANKKFESIAKINEKKAELGKLKVKIKEVKDEDKGN